MILANLTRAIREQNYYAVALEFLIVIAGVVIGFQIQGWSEDRHNRQLEQDYLLRLHNDFKCMVYTQNNNQGWDDTRVRSQQVVLDTLLSGELAEEDSVDFHRGLALLGIHNPLRWQWGTVDELNTTGNITLIQDTTLRDRLGQAESDYERDKKIIEIAVDQIEISRGKITHAYRLVEYSFSSGGESFVDFDLEALSANDAFIAELSHLQLNSRVVLTFSQGHLDNLIELEAYLADMRNVAPLDVEAFDTDNRIDCDELIRQLETVTDHPSS